MAFERKMDVLSAFFHSELKNTNSEFYKACKAYDKDTFETSLADLIDVFDIINENEKNNKNKIKQSDVLGETIGECILVNDPETRDEHHLNIKKAMLDCLSNNISVIKKVLMNQNVSDNELKKGIDNVREIHPIYIPYKLSASTSHQILSPTSKNRNRLTSHPSATDLSITKTPPQQKSTTTPKKT